MGNTNEEEVVWHCSVERLGMIFMVSKAGHTRAAGFPIQNERTNSLVFHHEDSIMLLCSITKSSGLVTLVMTLCLSHTVYALDPAEKPHGDALTEVIYTRPYNGKRCHFDIEFLGPIKHGVSVCFYDENGKRINYVNRDGWDKGRAAQGFVSEFKATFVTPVTAPPRGESGAAIYWAVFYKDEAENAKETWHLAKFGKAVPDQNDEWKATASGTVTSFEARTVPGSLSQLSFVPKRIDLVRVHLRIR